MPPTSFLWFGCIFLLSDVAQTVKISDHRTIEQAAFGAPATFLNWLIMVALLNVSFWTVEWAVQRVVSRHHDAVRYRDGLEERTSFEASGTADLVLWTWLTTTVGVFAVFVVADPLWLHGLARVLVALLVATAVTIPICIRMADWLYRSLYGSPSLRDE